MFKTYWTIFKPSWNHVWIINSSCLCNVFKSCIKHVYIMFKSSLNHVSLIQTDSPSMGAVYPIGPSCVWYRMCLDPMWLRVWMCVFLCVCLPRGDRAVWRFWARVFCIQGMGVSFELFGDGDKKRASRQFVSLFFQRRSAAFGHRWERQLLKLFRHHCLVWLWYLWGSAEPLSRNQWQTTDFRNHPKQ